jgi:kynurenine 3-monooxygenase
MRFLAVVLALHLGTPLATAAGPLSATRCAIVGGGPAGLLLAHRLLENGATVKVFEGREDPRIDGSPEGRAYALGLGLRGRTAIRTADDGALWERVARAGFASDKFTLHLPFGAFDLRKPDPRMEPSILIYQTDLCSAMLDVLEEQHGSSGRLSLQFNARVTGVDPLRGEVEGEQFDCVAGCDGVQSSVRASMCDAAADRCLEVETVQLPGFLKVVRLPRMPAALASDAVHLVPGAGGLAAFLEPTSTGCCALISWKSGGAAEQESPGAITDPVAARALLASSFPTLRDQLDTADAGAQFFRQRVSTASTVRCGSYHLGRAVLLGDAAHSTGGASGQGCNSALQDAAALATALERFGGDVKAATAAYSRERVPEGHALLDLSVGPSREVGGLRRALFGLSSIADTLLSKVGLSEPPLQTLLTTSLKPFAQIRRDRTALLGEFPSNAEFAKTIEEASRVADSL